MISVSESKLQNIVVGFMHISRPALLLKYDLASRRTNKMVVLCSVPRLEQAIELPGLFYMGQAYFYITAHQT